MRKAKRKARKTYDRRKKETTALVSSVGADEGQPSKTYTSISAETADRFRSDMSLKPRRATVATIATMFLGVVFYRRTVAQRESWPPKLEPAYPYRMI